MTLNSEMQAKLLAAVAELPAEERSRVLQALGKETENPRMAPILRGGLIGGAVGAFFEIFFGADNWTEIGTVVGAGVAYLRANKQEG